MSNNEVIQQLADSLSNAVAELTQAIATITVTGSQVVVYGGLSDISERLGLIQAGEFRAGGGGRILWRAPADSEVGRYGDSRR